jgi:hypothetical protein
MAATPSSGRPAQPGAGSVGVHPPAGGGGAQGARLARKCALPILITIFLVDAPSPILAGFDPPNWVGPSVIITQWGTGPNSTQTGGVGVFPAPGTKGPTLADNLLGFNYTNVDLLYQSDAADVNKVVTIVYEIQRSLNDPAGIHYTESSLMGSLSLPANTVAGITLLTFYAGNVQNTSASAFQRFDNSENNMRMTFQINSDSGKTSFNFNGGADMMIQRLILNINGPNIGFNTDIILSGGNGASSTTDVVTVPEPSALLIFSIGGLGLLTYARRCCNR